VADRLTAEQLAQCTGPSPMTRPRHTLTIDAVDYSDRLILSGKVKWKLTNRHPKRTGNIPIPIASLKMNNGDGLLTVGNAAGPWPTDEARRASVIVSTITICSPAKTVDSFTGSADEPFYDDDGNVEVGIVHPLKMAEDREWQRDDSTSDWNTVNTITRDNRQL